MNEATSKPVKTNSVDGLKLSWRDHKYHRFYTVVNQLVDELQGHVWSETGKPKRRLKGDGLEQRVQVQEQLGISKASYYRCLSG